MQRPTQPQATFTFSSLRTPRQQRDKVLAAQRFAPIQLHPVIERQLARAHEITEAPPREIRTNWQLFGAVLRELRGLVWELVGWTTLSALMILGSVLVVQQIFHASSATSTGVTLCFLFLILKVLQAFLEYCIANLRLQVHRGVQLSLYRLINEKLARISPAGRSAFSSGQLKTLIGSDVESIEDFISAALMQWTPALVSTIVVAPALWFVSGFAGICGLLTALAVIPVAAFGAHIVEKFQVKAQAEQDRLITQVGEWVKHIRLVRFLGWDRVIEHEVNDRMWSYIWRAALRHAAVVSVWALTFSWIMAPLIVIGALSALSSSPLNLVEIFSSLWILDYLMFQIQNIPHSLSLYGTACAGGDRVIQLLSQPDLQQSFKHAPPINVEPTSYPTKLVLTNLTKQFGEVQALRGVTTVIDLLSRTAIVGSVAGGKSTLLECLIGELPPTAGSIQVEFSDGRSGDLWHPDIYAAFRRHIAYSPQQPFLSNASVQDNIDLSSSAAFEDIQAALALAQLSEDLQLFPRGLNEEVGESGINLSGGQRQRVSLARAFISGRSVMVLDDPLSAVDPNTERALMNSIISHSRGLILVSHRLTELQTCDRVIVIEKGAIVEDGDPSHLASLRTSRFSAFLRATEDHDI